MFRVLGIYNFELHINLSILPLELTGNFLVTVVSILAKHYQKAVETSQPPLNFLPVFIITEKILVQSFYVVIQIQIQAVGKSLLSFNIQCLSIKLPAFSITET